MPFYLKRKPGTNLWWLITSSGKLLSKTALPLNKAKKQLIAITIALQVAASKIERHKV